MNDTLVYGDMKMNLENGTKVLPFETKGGIKIITKAGKEAWITETTLRMIVTFNTKFAKNNFHYLKSNDKILHEIQNEIY